MGIEWGSVLGQITTTTVIVAVIGWVAKSIVTQLLKRDLDQHKVSLKSVADERLLEMKREADAQLQAQQHAFEVALQTIQAELASKAARAERMRLAVERWANPILGAVRDLKFRLKNILKDDAFPALDAKRSAGQSKKWSISYAYFMPSTIYLCAQYFCWVRLLEEDLTFELFSGAEGQKRFMDAIRNVGESLSKWPLTGSEATGSGPDQQVFRLQQRVIGEALMATADKEPPCMRAETFLRRWESDPAFRHPFEPLAQLLEGVKEGSYRCNRLQLMWEALGELEVECEHILSPSQIGDPPAC